MIDAVYGETLRAAAAVAGGTQALALRLGVDLPLLHQWLAGEAKPPVAVFIETLEVIDEAPWRSSEAGGTVQPD